MQLFHHMTEWCDYRRQLPNHLSLGFVPTMGNLHRGHQSLYTLCREENDRTIASLFINPTQFNNPTDFDHYPRTLDNDLTLLEEAGVDYCLLPTTDAMYADQYQYQLQDTDTNQRMEGLHRPGHFTGVLTIVMKLFNLVKPHKAYFGEKDYQQLQLIRGMVDAFFMSIDVRACPTVREPSGLACSSRNNRLTKEQRQLADAFARIFHQKNLSNDERINQLHQLGIPVEYLEEHQRRRFIAVLIGDVRLIDNDFI